MRPVHLADIEIATRVLLAVAPCERAYRMTALINNANVADRYRKRVGRPHPIFGTGTLMSAAASFCQSTRPGHMDPNTLDALAAVINGLTNRHRNQLL